MGMEWPKTRGDMHKENGVKSKWFQRRRQGGVQFTLRHTTLATRLTTRQSQDWGPAGDKTCQSHSHATELGLHGIGNKGRESKLRRDCHRLEGREGMEGWGSAEFWTNRGKFYNHVGTETLVRHWGLRAAQQPTYDQLYKASVRVRAEWGRGSCLLVTSMPACKTRGTRKKNN